MHYTVYEYGEIVIDNGRSKTIERVYCIRGQEKKITGENIKYNA